MNRILFLIVASLMLFFMGCEPNTPSAPVDPPECTTANESTKCKDTEYCKEGSCKRKRCSEDFPDDDLCSEGKECKEYREGKWKCVTLPCGLANPNGLCENGKFCDNGTCVNDDACSSSKPEGRCPAGKTCISGSCAAITCSSSNPTGTCPTGLVCKNGICAENSCSEANPNGSCKNNNQHCVSGVCVNYECSAEHPNGVCENGKACNSGICEEVACDKDHPTGVCPDGKLCVSVNNGGTPSFECQEPADCNNTDKLCDPGFFCSEGKCKRDESCIPACDSQLVLGYEKEVCKFTKCIPNPELCGPDSVNGKCPEGQVCSVNGICKDLIVDPCISQPCEAGEQCIVTSYENQTRDCVVYSDLCSESNPNGRCDEGQTCIAGVCSDYVDPCIGVECSVGKICNPATALCEDDACDPAPRCPKEGEGPIDTNMMCLNTFSSNDGYICNCKPGYDMIFNQENGYKCVEHGDICDGHDCGLGHCFADDGVEGGWECKCDDHMVNSIPNNPKSDCVNPTNYDFCLNMDCGHGTCTIVNSGEDREAICNCDANYLFNGTTCIPGIDCGNTICEDPLAQACENNMCRDKACDDTYTHGYCVENGETCIEGVCKMTQECHGNVGGYCVADNYSCKSGVCCKGGICSNTDQSQKLIGETCDLATNNCENNAYCIPTPTGDGICMKTCDTSVSSTCDTDAGYHCLANGIFTEGNFQYTGVCVKDDNCIVTDNTNCNEQQVCLNVRNSSATQCYAKNKDAHTGASCNVGTSALGFNIGCDQYNLCVNGKCVPNCSRRNLDLVIGMCYDSSKGIFDIKDLKIKDFPDFEFSSGNRKENTTLCTPGSNSCNGESCIQVQEKDPTEATSKALGICSTSCNFDGVPYRAQCSNNKICFKKGNSTLCLDGNECDPYTNSGCIGSLCYPITESTNSCMSNMNEAHLTEACNLTNLSCQEGMCVNGTCQLVCDMNDNSFTCETAGQTCQTNGDSYLNNSSHFANAHYGTCQ